MSKEFDINELTPIKKQEDFKKNIREKSDEEKLGMPLGTYLALCEQDNYFFLI